MNLLDIGCMFDWISPAVATVGDVINGPSSTLLIPRSCGWSPRELMAELRKHGVKTRGEMIVDGTIMLTVQANQERFARHLLQKRMVPVE